MYDRDACGERNSTQSSMEAGLLNESGSTLRERTRCNTRAQSTEAICFLMEFLYPLIIGGRDEEEGYDTGHDAEGR